MSKRGPRRRPLIGVTGPDRGGWVAWTCSRMMVWLAGGQAVRITPANRQALADLQGLILGGGADIHPSRYKEQHLATIKREAKKISRVNLAFLFSILVWLVRELFSLRLKRPRTDKERDDLEFSALREAVHKEIPVLGICRGSQLINVFWGGSLYQNLDEFYVETPRLQTIRPRKLIHIEPGTSLERILGGRRSKVNSLHKQSVKKLGHELKVSARETNGVVQAIEHQGYPFVIGVQWHPEFLPFNPDQRRVFQHLVAAARRHPGMGNLSPT